MIKKILSIILGLNYIILVSCTSSSSSQVDSPVSSELIVGQGAGVNQEEADENAIYEISKYFSTVISANQEVNDNASQTGDSSSDLSSVSTQIDIKSDSILHGVEIVKRWNDSSLYYSIAHLDKNKSMALFRKIIAKKDMEELREFKLCCSNSSKIIGNPFQLLGNILELKKKRVEREKLNNQFMILSHHPVQDPLPQNKLLEVESSVLKKLTIYINIPKDQPNELVQYISTELSKLKIKVTDIKSQASHIITPIFKVSIEQKSLKGWVFVNGYLDISIMDTTGNSISQSSNNYTTSALSESVSVSEVVDILVKKWMSQLRNQN